MDAALAVLSPDLLYNEPRYSRSYSRYAGRDKYRLQQPGSIDDRIPESLRNLSRVVADWASLDLSDEDRFDINALARRYMEMAQVLDSLNALEGDGDSYVYWSEIEGRGRNKHVTLSALEIGRILENFGQQCLRPFVGHPVTAAPSVTSGIGDRGGRGGYRFSF